MAKMNLDLNAFSSAGVYTLEYDASERTVIDTQTVRLVIGFSRKGPFNAPVYLPDAKTMKTVFGDVDKFLEKQGSYFHRMCYTALDVGPVFALNLLPLNNHADLGDKVDYQSFSLASTEFNGTKIKKLYSSFFNKERFWFPDQDYFLANVNSPGSVNEGKILNVVNLSQKPTSVLIRKILPKEFAVSAVEWYGAGNVPAYIYEDDLIQDYFVELTIVEGDWTDYTKLSIDPIFSEYFDRNGLKKAKFKEFLSAPEVTTINSTIGTIIPDFVDKREVNYSIDTLVNQSFARTGIFVAINRDILDDYDNFNNEVDTDAYSAIDMIGHNLAKAYNPDDARENPEIMDFLSYRNGIQTSYDFALLADHSGELLENASYYLGSSHLSNLSGQEWRWESQYLGDDYGYYNNVISIEKPGNEVGENHPSLIEYYKIKNQLIANQSIIRISENHYAMVKQVYEVEDNGTRLKIKISNKQKATETTDGFADQNIGPYPAIVLASMINTSSETSVSSTGLPAGTYDKVLLTHATEDSVIFDCSQSTAATATKITIDDVDFDAWATGATITEWTVARLYDVVKVGLGDFNITNVDFTASEDFVGITLENDADDADWLDDMISSYNDNDDLLVTTPAGEQYYLKITTDNGGVAGIVSTSDKFIFYVDKTEGDFALFQAYLVELGATADTDYAITGIDIKARPYNPNVLFVNTSLSIDDLAPLPSSGSDLGSTEATASAANIIKFVARPDKFYQDADDDGILYAYKYNKIYNYYDLGIVKDGNTVEASETSAQEPLEFDTVIDSDSGVVMLKIEMHDTYTVETDAYGVDLPGTFADDVTVTFGSSPADPVVITTDFGDAKEEISYISATLNVLKTEFAITEANKNEIETGDYIVSYKTLEDGTKDYRLAKVLSKIRRWNSGQNAYVYYITTTTAVHSVTNSEGADLYKVVRIKPLDDLVSNYRLFSLGGFTMTAWHMPSKASQLAQLEKILGVLDGANTNLTKMLKDKNVIQYRYIIDTFSGSINPNTYPKTYITKLAMARKQCLAIMNAPAIQEFIESTDPRFTEEPSLIDPKPILNTSYIADGGNLTLGPSFRFTLPDEGNGSKYCGYFAPNLILREGGKNISVPPAAHVSNQFVMKFINGTPFKVVAGTKRGVLSDAKLAGLEYDFLTEDRDVLEPLGINPIIKLRGIGDAVIYGNKMAYQKTLSAFNNLHVRDLLITIEDGIEDILSNYLFEFNDATTRLEIKTRVDKFLDGVRSAGGIYDFLVIMNEENNPPEIIDQNVGIIDVAIEPARSMDRIFNRVTILKTGGLASGGFSV